MQWENGTHFPDKEGTWTFSKHVIVCKLWSSCPSSRKSIITGFQNLGNVPGLNVAVFLVKGQVWSKKVLLDATLNLDQWKEGKSDQLHPFLEERNLALEMQVLMNTSLDYCNTFKNCWETVLSHMHGAAAVINNGSKKMPLDLQLMSNCFQGPV